MSKKEIRLLENNIEVRELKADDETVTTEIVGYALRFDTYSNDLGGFIETIEPTALNEANMDDVVALFNHNRDYVLGRTTSETLKLSVDEFGLKYTITPPDTTFARDLMESMKRGDISQSSFAFSLDYEDEEAEDWRFDEDKDIYVRTIRKFKGIHDVSVVTTPAYSDTPVVVSKRGLEDYQKELQNNLTKRKLLIELDL